MKIGFVTNKPEVLPPVRALHEHGLRVILGVGLGITKHHRVEVFGPEHGEAPDHDGDHKDDEAIAETLLLRGSGPGLGDGECQIKSDEN